MDQSLDEIIQSKRKNNFNRQKPNSANPSPINKRGRITKRTYAPSLFAKSNNEQWTHDMFRGNRNNNRSGHKIQISNLDFGVNDEDVNELFKEFGQITRAGVNYDRSGRSLGTAEVVYANKTSAIQARNKYNGIPLDNKPMKITILESNSVSAFNRVGQVSRLPISRNMNNGNNMRPRSNPPMRRNNNNNRNSSNGRNQKVVKTKEQLDAEMDEYLSKTG